MEPEYATDRMIEAILTNQQILLLPRIMYLFYAIKGYIILFYVNEIIFN